MDLSLIRRAFRIDGIFSELINPLGDEIFTTCERSYSDRNGNFFPKLTDGVFQCVRGFHRLDHSVDPVETFEITNVPGHTGILFHVGNFNRDSDGCVLLGLSLVQISGQQAVSQSSHAFQEFMDLQFGCEQFVLTVKSN